LDRVIRHTVVFHLSTSTYIPNFIGIGKTFCARTDGRKDGRASETHFIRSTLRSRPNNVICLSLLVGLTMTRSIVTQLQWKTKTVGTCKWHICCTDAVVLSGSRCVTSLSTDVDGDWLHVAVHASQSQDCRHQTLKSLQLRAAQS